MGKESAFAIELCVFTQGHDANALAKLLPVDANSVVNRGQRHAKGGLVPDWGIPQSGCIRYINKFTLDLAEDQSSVLDFENEFLGRFNGCDAVFGRLRREFECELEVVLRLYADAPVLSFGPRFSHFLGIHEMSLTVLVDD